MTNENKAIDILIKKIVSLVDSRIANLKYDKTFQSTIWGINDDGTYKINYLGEMYNVPNALPITLSLGQKVEVNIPSGVFRNMYISGAQGATAIASEGGGGEGTSSHSHANKTVLDGITSALVTKWNNAFSHISDAVKHITSDERELWNTVSDKAEINHTHTMDDLTDYTEPDLSDFAHKDDIPSVDGFITEEELNDTLADYVKSEDIVDFDVTELTQRIESVEGALDDKADKTDIPNVDNFVEKEEGKGLFSGSYNDLTNKPTIPSVDGLVSETELNTTLTSYAKKADLPTKVSDLIEDTVIELTQAEYDALGSEKLADVTYFITDGETESFITEEMLDNTLSNYAKKEDIPTELPASDVYAWAKEKNKPTYTASEVGADASGSASTALSNAKTYTDGKIAGLINGAPTTLDTLKEIADAMAENDEVVEALNEAIGTKASASDLSSHTSNTTVHITSTERTNWGSAYSHSTSAHAPSNAEKNQNAFSNVVVGSTTIAADIATDTLTLVAGDNITITPDATNDKITISSTDTVYTHPTSGATAGTYRSVTVDAQGHVTGGTNPTITVAQGGTGATTAKAAEYNVLSGMTEATTDMTDSSHITFTYASPSTTQGKLYWRKATALWDYIKGKADSEYIKGLSVSGKTITYTKGDNTTGTITTQDTTYTHPTTAGNKHIPSGGSSGQILKWSASGTAVWANESSGGIKEVTSSSEPTGQSVGSYWLKEY